MKWVRSVVGAGVWCRVVWVDIIKKVRSEQRLGEGRRELGEQALGGRPFQVERTARARSLYGESDS